MAPILLSFCGSLIGWTAVHRVPWRPSVPRVLLEIDLGELPDEPEALYALADAANIACGGHAGDDASMTRALALCETHDTLPGAHPSYPDREGFGRRRLEMEAAALAEAV